MKRANQVIASIMFMAFVVIILLWTATLTWSLVARILPGDQATSWFALALFDGGALTWLYVWKSKAKGAGQRGIALLMMVIDLIGVIIMAGGEIALSQSFFDPGDLGKYLVYALIGWTLLNVAAVYGFHVNDPETLKDAEVRDVQDEVQEESLKQLRAKMQRISASVSDALAFQATEQALRELLPPGTSPDVINAYARPVQHKLPGTTETMPPAPAGYQYTTVQTEQGTVNVLTPIPGQAQQQPQQQPKEKRRFSIFPPVQRRRSNVYQSDVDTTSANFTQPGQPGTE